MFMGETINTLYWMRWTLVEVQISSVGGPALKHALKIGCFRYALVQIKVLKSHLYDLIEEYVGNKTLRMGILDSSPL